ncbi:hypothetical protein CD006_25130 [Enterobacter sp. 10-1]|uniref:hypothetical protein n=1 Tax=Raoultella sp. 10-1 TaxID=2683201 RepID=UPI000BA4119B|nr:MULTISPECIES: hypothetical protein [Enterobacteriaceae]MVT05853.1 hypothetical protein [Raoultella sp. 10-1]PAC07699.1 hypothetical protein CD006_25130 [Enterobacter sp. 10-1]
MRKLSALLITFVMTACVSLQPYGKDTKVTQSYYYKDSTKPRAVYSCMQDELFSQGYLLEYGKLNNKFGVNRFDVTRKSENVASLEINTAGSSVSSQAFVKNDRVRKDIDAVQSYCVKNTGHSASIVGAVIEGLWEGLK